ncbi:hypothetical protein ACP3V3_01985 [Vibrio sp. PNB22_3_1]
MGRFLVLMVIAGSMVPGFGLASDLDYERSLSGYAKVLVDTKLEQKDPLSKVVTFRFPSGVKNIGQALNYVLSATGYGLADLGVTQQEVLRLYTRRLPEVNAAFSQATVRQVIQSLVGDAYVVSVDDVARVVRIVRGE